MIAACGYRVCETTRQIIDIHVSAVDSLKLAQAQTPQKSLQAHISSNKEQKTVMSQIAKHYIEAVQP